MDDYGKTKDKLISELQSLRFKSTELEKISKQSKHMFQELLETAPDAVVVVNTAGEIVLVNKQTETIFGYAREELLGENLDILLPERFRHSHKHHMADFMGKPGTRPMGAKLSILGRRKDGSEVPLDIALSHLKYEDQIWATSIIRDVTERRNAENEREKLISELQNALDHVKALSGLLPICVCCKKIRDDKGYWNQIEQYISDHSEAEFTHGMCPKCYREKIDELRLNKAYQRHSQ
jgi:PAS domain S-box-containing protein